MIDHGFTQADGSFINSYFSMLMIMAIVLAVASALRYYFVITLGERIVSDLRRDVFGHVTRLSPSFFDVNQSGEIVSRLTADTTQIKSAVGATASVALAQPHPLSRRHGHDDRVPSPKLSSLVIGGDSVDRLSAGRLRPLGAQALARGPGYAGGRLRLRQRGDRRQPHRPGLRRRGRRCQPLWGRCRERPMTPPARPSARARC